MYDYLTGVQKADIIAEAVDAVSDNAQRHANYRQWLARQWVEGVDIYDQLRAISHDPEVVCGILGFDPETGQVVHDT